MKTFKQYLEEMAFNISDLIPAGQASKSTHDVSQMKLKDTNELYFVKFSDSDMYDDISDASIHPIVEYLAYKIYKLFKVKVPEVDLVVDGDVIGLASSAIKGKSMSHQDLKKIKNVADFFAVSAFLANWDLLGTGYTAANIIVDDGVATLIDPGGALTFRAQGGRKGSMFSNEVGEVNTLRDPQMSQAAEVFKGVNITKSMKEFIKVPWSKVKALLKSENDYINSVISKKLDKVWKREYTEILSKLEARYKSMSEIIRKTI